MIISYLITALVVFSLIGSVVYAMWKCAKRIAFILSIFLFIILVAVVVKVFFNKENVEKLHANISASGIDQIAENAAAKSVDAVKRRVRAGMGRCQAGFCGPKVLEILARELGVAPEEINKHNPGSYMVTGNSR